MPQDPAWLSDFVDGVVNAIQCDRTDIRLARMFKGMRHDYFDFGSAAAPHHYVGIEVTAESRKRTTIDIAIHKLLTPSVLAVFREVYVSHGLRSTRARVVGERPGATEPVTIVIEVVTDCPLH